VEEIMKSAFVAGARSRHFTALAAALLAATSFAWAASPSDEDKDVRLHALAVNMSNVGATGATPIDIGITDWSTNEEVQKLRTALREKGSEALASELQEMKRVGFIRSSSGGLGWTLRFAQRKSLPNGGQRIVFATDRPMTFMERMEQPRTADYDLLVGEVRLGPDGKGQGTLVPMARVLYEESDDSIEIENFASQPIRLNEVVDLSAHDDKEPARRDED
jgi:hypothetical protein